MLVPICATGEIYWHISEKFKTQSFLIPCSLDFHEKASYKLMFDVFDKKLIDLVLREIVMTKR